MSGEAAKGGQSKRERWRFLLRDGPLENLWGGGRSTKKNIRARENEMKKNLCTPINPKKYSCYGLKKIHTRNLITKKILRLENSPPPHNFSNGLSLKREFT